MALDSLCGVSIRTPRLADLRKCLQASSAHREQHLVYLDHSSVSLALALSEPFKTREA